MKCWRIDLHSKLVLYLDSNLAPQAVTRLEGHLLDCGECRARLAQMRTGKQLALQIPQRSLKTDPWQAIAAAIETKSPLPTPTKSTLVLSQWLRIHLVNPWVTTSLITITLVLLAVIVISNSRSLTTNGNGESTIALESLSTTMDLSEFSSVTIADIKHNTEPHIVAEGYVSEVRMDKDGDLTFKLVEDLRQLQPFIVCEIIDSFRITPPKIGSRVRVYGVSRYDGKQGHEWYEVHPVINIEMVSK
jgi:hypothetical protein